MKATSLLNLPEDKKALLPLHILTTLQEDAKLYDPNAEFRLVGGCVRDTLIGRKPKDFDIVTNTTASVLGKMGLENVGKAFPVYLYKDQEYGQMEIAVARSEEKTAPGHKGFDTVPTGNFDDDMVRRDLTINALMVDSNGTVYGPAGVLKQIEQKLLQNVSEKFSEDPLRVFRVARFSAQFGSEWTISGTLSEQMRKVQHELGTLPADRVREEFRKAMAGSYPLNFFETLRIGGCIKPWFDEVEQNWNAVADAIRYGSVKNWTFEQYLVGIGSNLQTPDSLMNRLGVREQIKKAIQYVKTNKSKLESPKSQSAETVAHLVQSGSRGVLGFRQLLDCTLLGKNQESGRYLLDCLEALNNADMTGVQSREEALGRAVEVISKVATTIDVIYVKVNSPSIIPKFLFYWFEHQYQSGVFKSMLKGSVIPGLNIKDVLEMNFYGKQLKTVAVLGTSLKDYDFAIQRKGENAGRPAWPTSHTKVSMSAPTDKMRSRTYWHGTANGRAAKSIVREGIRPGNETDQHLYIDDESVVPQEGRIYLGNLDVALQYASGASIHAVKEESGYVFKVDGNKLMHDCEPDEDFVGAMAYRCGGYDMHDMVGFAEFQPKDFQLFKHIFERPLQDVMFLYNSVMAAKEEAEEEGDTLFWDDPGWTEFVYAGNRVLRHLSDGDKVKIMESFQTPVAHSGAIMPAAGWAIPVDYLEKVNSESDLNKFGKRIL